MWTYKLDKFSIMFEDIKNPLDNLLFDKIVVQMIPNERGEYFVYFSVRPNVQPMQVKQFFDTIVVKENTKPDRRTRTQRYQGNDPYLVGSFINVIEMSQPTVERGWLRVKASEAVLLSSLCECIAPNNPQGTTQLFKEALSRIFITPSVIDEDGKVLDHKKLDRFSNLKNKRGTASTRQPKI